MAKDIPDYMREFDTSDDWGFTPVTSKPEPKDNAKGMVSFRRLSSNP